LVAYPTRQSFVRNQGNGTLVDTPLEAGIADPILGASGGAWCDYTATRSRLFVTKLGHRKEGTEFVPTVLLKTRRVQ
jgi:hypothetical protein